MMNNNKTLYDFQNEWVKLLGKEADYSSFNSDERIWYNIEVLINAWNDGGLISYYYNSYAEYVADTIEDLNFLGFPDVADMLIQINKIFPDEQPPIDMDERNAVISNWPDGKYDFLLETLDEKFSDVKPKLESKLIEHIEAKILNRK